MTLELFLIGVFELFFEALGGKGDVGACDRIRLETIADGFFDLGFGDDQRVCDEIGIADDGQEVCQDSSYVVVGDAVLVFEGLDARQGRDAEEMLSDLEQDVDLLG